MHKWQSWRNKNETSCIARVLNFNLAIKKRILQLSKLELLSGRDFFTSSSFSFHLMEKVVKSPHYNNFHFKKGVVNQVFLVGGGWPHLQVFVDLASSSHGSGVFNWKAWKVKEVTRQAKGVVQNCQIGNHHRNPRRATSGQGFSKHDMQSPNHDLTTFATTDAAAKPRIQTSLSFLFINSSVIPAFHFNFEDAPGSSQNEV